MLFRSGLYAIAYNDTDSTSANFGVSVNAAALNVEIYNLSNVSDAMLTLTTAQTANAQACMGGAYWLTAADVVRAHGETAGQTNPHVIFRIVRIL